MTKKFILIFTVILIIIAVGVFYFLYKQPQQGNIGQDDISSELKKLNITVTGKSKQMELQLPATLTDANWGLKKIICEEGGYNLSVYAGQTVLLTQYLTNEVYRNTEPLNMLVVSSGGKIICVFKTVTENSNMAPGVFSVKENPLIKKK